MNWALGFLGVMPSESFSGVNLPQIAGFAIFSYCPLFRLFPWFLPEVTEFREKWTVSPNAKSLSSDKRTRTTKLSPFRCPNCAKQIRLGGKAASFIGSSFGPARARSCDPEFDAAAAHSNVRLSSN
jgi:hypothetical protein